LFKGPLHGREGLGGGKKGRGKGEWGREGRRKVGGIVPWLLDGWTPLQTRIQEIDILLLQKKLFWQHLPFSLA